MATDQPWEVVKSEVSGDGHTDENCMMGSRISINYLMDRFYFVHVNTLLISPSLEARLAVYTRCKKKKKNHKERKKPKTS